MPAAVVDIDVRDQKFQRFNELFSAYQKNLAATPGLWKEAAEEVAPLAAQFERMSAALLAQNEVAREFKEEDEARLRRLTATEKLWTSIGKSSTVFAKNILDAGATLIKWGGALAGGLIGGSLYGIDRLGAAAADQRRSSLGLGLSTGEQSAFHTNFSRFIDPDSFLSGVSTAASDVSKQGSLYGIGVNPNQSTADVALDTLKKIRAMALGMPVNQLGILESSRHLDQLGISTGDLRRLRSASPDEFNRQLSHYKGDVSALGFGDKTGEEWQTFTDQMHRASQEIFKVFVERLAPLAGPLTHLSDAVVHVIERFANGGAIETGIDDLAKYLNEFTGVIGKPEFLNKVERFASDMGVLGDVVHAAADAVEHPGAAIGKAVMADLTAGQQARWDGIKALVSGVGSGIHSGWNALMHGGQMTSLGNLDKSYGLPAGALEAIYGKESSYGANAIDQPGKDGAQGGFQIKPSQGGGADLHSFDSSSRQAATIFARELKRYHGDSLKALAAYHLGDTQLDKVIGQYGKDWSKHVKYVADIKIENKTGADIIVQSSQLTQ